MLPCHSCYSYWTWRSKELGGIKVIVWREVEGVSHKVKRCTSYGGVDPSGILSELPSNFSLFWSKKSHMICTAQYSFFLIKACVHYFSLFLKGKCISSLFRTKYIKKKFNLQLFFLPTVSQTFILSGATRRYPPP